jgi:hypothetical protein
MSAAAVASSAVARTAVRGAFRGLMRAVNEVSGERRWD